MTPYIHLECNYNFKEQLEYLTSSLNLIVLYNNERFEAHLYGDKKIVKESVITQWSLNPASPSWLPFFVEIEELEDETALL